VGRYKIEIELLSEAIFGSGYSIPGSVDLEVVYGNYGLPYMKAKTFKGNLREHMEDSVTILKNCYNRDFSDELNKLLGKENSGIIAWGSIKLSDCCIQENIKNFFAYAVENNEIYAKEIRDALRGLKLYSDIYCERSLSDRELAILALSVSSMRHIGSMRTRGKGEVRLRLLLSENGRWSDKTDYYIDKLMEEVKKVE